MTKSGSPRLRFGPRRPSARDPHIAAVRLLIVRCKRSSARYRTRFPSRRAVSCRRNPLSARREARSKLTPGEIFLPAALDQSRAAARSRREPTDGTAGKPRSGSELTDTRPGVLGPGSAVSRMIAPAADWSGILLEVASINRTFASAMTQLCRCKISDLPFFVDVSLTLTFLPFRTALFCSHLDFIV